jgi:hypothetical protein
MEVFIAFLTLIITYYFSTKQFRKSLIIHFKIKSHEVERKIFKNFGDLKFEYENTEIEKDLRLHRGIIFVLGDKDIPRDEQREHTIRIHNLTNETNYKDIKIINSNANFKIQKDSNNILLSNEIIKVGDFALFELLFESPKDQIDIDYRIYDTKRKSKILDYLTPKNILTATVAWSLLCALLIFCIIFISNETSTEYKKIVYLNDRKVDMSEINKYDSSFISGMQQVYNDANVITKTLLKEKLISAPIEEFVNTQLREKVKANSYVRIDTLEIYLASYQILDSLTKNKPFYKSFFNSAYKEKYKIRNGYKVSYEFNGYYIIVGLSLFIIGFYFCLYMLFQTLFLQFRFFRPLNLILKQHEIQIENP